MRGSAVSLLSYSGTFGALSRMAHLPRYCGSWTIPLRLGVWAE
jgi:hypothetical protein